MGNYSIKELEKLSGIKAHTIRIWEKRFAIIKPKRTATNIRFYSDDDLKRILNISLLNNHGIKISKLVEMSEKELSAKVIELGSSSLQDNEVYIDLLITAMIDLEEESFISVLNSITDKIGFEKAVTTVYYPFLHKIGILWHTGNITPAQEHFITHLIRQKMIVAIDQLPIPSKTKKKAVLYLPEGEFHEIGLLFYHYITRKFGLRTYYLGQTVPFNDLKSVYKTYKPAAIITCITSSPGPEELSNYLANLCHTAKASQIMITGYALAKANLKKEENLHLFKTPLELQELLQAL